MDLFDKHLVEEEVVSYEVSVVFEAFREGVYYKLSNFLSTEIVCINRCGRPYELEEVEKVVGLFVSIL